MDDSQPTQIYKIHGTEIGVFVNGAFVGADAITSAQIEAFSPTLVSDFAGHCALLRVALREEALLAAGDPDKLRTVARKGKSFASQLASWNDRLGGLTTTQLRRVELGIGEDSDFIFKLVSEAASEQCDAADWWKKHLPGAPDFGED
ncbi:MAG TPA: hypothetical protein VGG02_14505 [Chthoniobacterales bacterium]|jgi:hypothetical protein